MANLDRLRYLWQQYTGRDSSREEYEELFARIRKGAADEPLEHWLAEIWEELEPGEPIPGVDWERMYAQVMEVPVKRKLFRIHHAWAAVWIGILLIMGLGLYVYYKEDANPGAGAAVATNKADLPPGGDKAILTLAGGKQIILDSAANGRIAQQGNSSIDKASAGQLRYIHANQSPSAIFFNTLTTPRGGQYQLTLSDGTKVWLNAASSITYPTAFTEKEREVTVTGEAYFEIASDKANPFIVHSGAGFTTVLGTRFNVNAYADESLLQVTLLDGAVKYTTGAQEKILRPGQQAAYDPASAQLSIHPADTTQVVAWKNGEFEFDNRDLAAILRQVSRWYDVDVHYKQSPGPEKFGGGISRKLPLSSVLKLLENNGVRFELNGRQLTVIPSP